MNPLVQNLKKSFGPLVQPFVDGIKPPTAMTSTFATPKPVTPTASSSNVNMSMAPVKPVYPTPSGNPINMSLAPKKPVAPTAPTGDPAVRAQQIALNANGAGLKVDGILGPLTMAAIKKSESTVKKTPDGGIINPNTGGFSEAPVPPPTTTYPAPAVPEPTPTVSPYETNVTEAEKAYATAGQMTPEEEAAQAELDKLTESFKTGYQGIEDKVIPMNFITGQQASLEKRALNLAEPLQAKLARLQAKRTSALEASKFALDRADAKLKSEEDKTKLVSGTSFYDPATKTFKTAPEKATTTADGFSLSPGQIRYDAEGNPIAVAPKETSEDTGQSPYAKERNLRNLQSVDTLMGQVNNWTTGFGSLLSAIPTTDARNFRAQLDTLKANITFGELTAMREASKTGGALGQVSDKEGQLLGAALGALDTAVTPEQFKVQLNKIKESINRWNAEVDKTGGNTTGNVVQTTVGPINTNW